MANIKFILVVTLLAAASNLFAQAEAETHGSELGKLWQSNWQAGVYGGYFSEGTLIRTETPAGEPVKIKDDTSWLIGVRLGADQEYLGWETSFAAVFTDLDYDSDSAAEGVSSSGDANWLFTNFNLMLYPTGNELNDGRVKPFLTAGPGLVFFCSDDKFVDDEIMFDFNVGGGIKFLLGDDDSTVLRLDWKWHYIVAPGDFEDRILRHELTVGLGFTF